MHLTDRVVWITGASAGIGAALARRCANRGARLVLSARRADRLEAVRDACARPGDHLVVPLDLLAPETFPEAAARVEAAFGRVDVLVHNGGVSQRSLAAETDLSVVRRIMETNFYGTVALTKAVLPSMLARGAGHFVVISSVAGKVSTAKRSAYAASKHALHGYFDALRAETYDAGLRVTMVCPGYVRTDVSVNALTADGSAYGRMADAQAHGLSPEACAEAIVSAVEQEKDEIYPGGKETYAVALRRFLPVKTFNALVRRLGTPP